MWFLSGICHMIRPTFGRETLKYIKTFSPILYWKLVVHPEQKYNFHKIARMKYFSKSVLYARYATDVIFQQCYLTRGAMAECKAYFSGAYFSGNIKFTDIDQKFQFCSLHLQLTVKITIQVLFQLWRFFK